MRTNVLVQQAYINGSNIFLTTLKLRQQRRYNNNENTFAVTPVFIMLGQYVTSDFYIQYS